MTSRFARSYMKQKNIRFIVQIGSFSKYICKGYYSSPEFGNDEPESNLNLLVHVYDGHDHENFIDVRLKRNDYATEEQYINIKTSIVSCIGLNVLKKESKILLSNSDEARVLAVAKENLKEYFGLKKFFYLPSDTLTLQCDLIVYESNATSFEKQGFLSNVYDDRISFSEYYIHSCLREEDYDYFEWEIRNFSAHMYGGRTTSPAYQSNRLGGIWSLVACSTSGDYSTTFLDIRLMRHEGYEDQLIKAKLSITDSSGEIVLSNEKNVFITSSREVQLLSFPEKENTGWFVLKKNKLTSSDTLTLRCEMVLYKTTDDRFPRREDFDKSIKTYGYSRTQLIPYLPIICIMLFVSLHLCYSLCVAVMLFLWNTLLEVLHAMKYFLGSVVGISLLFSWIKRKAESIKRKQEAIEMKKKLREEKKAIQYNQYHEDYADSYPLYHFNVYKASRNYNTNCRNY